MRSDYTALVDDEPTVVTVESSDERSFCVRVGETELRLEVQSLGRAAYQLRLGDEIHEVTIERRPEGALVVHGREGATPVIVLDERELARRVASGAGSRRHAQGLVPLLAPMPGKIVKYLVRVGDEVKAGQGIVVVEAMKMENELRCVADGRVKQLGASEGQNVEAGVELAVIEAKPEAASATCGDDDNGNGS